MSFLKPSELIKIPEYTDWSSEKEIELSNNIKINVLEGQVKHKGCKGISTLYKLPQIATRKEVSTIRNLVKTSEFDSDPDSVDGMPTYELYIESPDINKNKNSMKLDHLKKRAKLRKKLRKVMKPIIENRINPYIRSMYSKHSDPSRQCTPCYSFIRRYKKNERWSHETHRDGHAFVTVVISLADYETEYKGGLYVATADRYKSMIRLNRGDGVVHQYDLLHGVKVYDNDFGERWSWVIWYKDSVDCTDFSKEWFKDKALEGIPVYQALYANVAPQNEMIVWHEKAAARGFTNSMVKLARAYLNLLPSHLEFSPEKAENLYKKAIRVTRDPHAQYGLAQMMLGGLIQFKNQSTSDLLKGVVILLEESAKGGNVFAMFNLGVAHLYGYTGVQNSELAKDWFEIANLPEGFIAASMYYNSVGKTQLAEILKSRAHKMGFGSAWRQVARQNTGLGGAAGVDINLPWPALPNGMKPPVW